MRTLLKWMVRGAAALLIVFVVAPYLVPMPERSPPPFESPYANGDFVQACGLRWHLQRWEAAGAPHGLAVLIHGFAGSTYSWRLSGPALAEAGWRVLAVDLPPYGFSERGRSADPLPACLQRIVEAEAAGQPIVPIGHSMGASVAAALAARLGEQAQGLVLVDGGVGGMGRAPVWMGVLLGLPPVGRWAEVAGHYRLLRPEAFADTLASAYGRRPSAEEVEGYRRPLLLAGTAPAILARPPMSEPIEASQLPGQVLIIWGREDRWVPPRAGEATHARLPQSQLAWIEAAGHNPMETHPAEFMQLLLGFLRPGAGAHELAPAEAGSDQHGEHSEGLGEST